MWLRPGIVASGAPATGGGGTISSASIESNGWVLRVTMPASLSSVVATPDTTANWAANFSAYALNPNAATPAMTISGVTNGYVQSAGTAVASSSVARTLIATKVLRKPVETFPLWTPSTAYTLGQIIGNGPTYSYQVTTAGTSATSGGPSGTGSSITDGSIVWKQYGSLRKAKHPDEIDNGNGTITIRIALSQHVYAGSNLTLAAASGWRTGAGASSGVTVTNNSTVPAPAPIVRWSDVSYQLQPGSFNLEVVVASFHPVGVVPIAGVKFTVTDGTTVKTYWATALSTSNAYNAGGTGKGVRVYSVTVDPTTATALTQGLLRCDFEVYPWIGLAQKSDTAGTKSMTGLSTAAYATSAFVPFVVAYNPANAWVTPRFIDIDETNGTSTPASVTVATTAAGAAAGTPANSINTALLAIYAANVTVAAANGQGAVTRSGDGLTITLRKANAGAGCTGIVNGAGTAAVSSGFQTLITPVIVRGDPTDGTARACIWRSPSTGNAGSRVTRLHVSALSVEAQTNAVMQCGATWLENVEVRGVSGQESTSGYPFGSTGGLLWATNTKYWKHATKLGYAGSSTVMLIRNCSVDRDMTAPIVLNSARLPSATGYGFSTPASITDAGLALERIAIGNNIQYLNGASMGIHNVILTANIPTNLTLGTTYPAIARIAYINNVGEVYGATAGMWGLATLIAFSEVVFEGNTLTGDRTNNPYGTVNDATIALTDAATPQSRIFRYANNITMKNANKQDSYNDPGILTQRQGVALSTTRSKAYAVGAEIVIAGSPAYVYHCTTAGTTASTGGPTGTGSSISDGSVVWSFFAYENRLHGYNPNGVGMWSSSYGVSYEGNIDFQGPAGPAYDPEFFFEFYGIGSQSLAVDGIDVTSDPFTLDKSGTPQMLPFQTGYPGPGTGGGNYKPLTTGSASYILGRAKTASVDVDEVGVARGTPTFCAGAIEA